MSIVHYLVLSAFLFTIGTVGVIVKKNVISMFLCIELMLNAVNINLVAFWRYTDLSQMTGQLFAVFVITVAAAEAAVGLALIITIYRQRHSVNVEELDTMKG